MALINSDYWIQGTCAIEVGEYSDTNHEGEASQTALSMLLYELDQEMDEPEEKDLAPALVMFIRENDLDLEREDTDDVGALFDKALPELLRLNQGKDERYFREMFDCACQVGDCREFPMEYLDWIAVRNNHIALWKLTREDFTSLCQGVFDIIGERDYNLDDEDKEEKLEEEFHIDVVGSGNYYSITFKDIVDRNYEVLGISHSVPEVGPNAQLAAADRALMNPTYNGKQGD